jgi:ABC-type transport system substrate-binding protein
MKNLRITVVAFGVLLAVVGLSARAQGPQKGGTLVTALPGDIISLDPAFDYDFNTSPVVQQMVEGLQKFDANNKVVPNIAETITNPDPLTYLYKIRKDVTFWDGSSVTIDDVIFSMERVKDPKTASYVGWMYQNVKSITKLDAQTVKVTLSKPDALWQYVGATTGASIIKILRAFKRQNLRQARRRRDGDRAVQIRQMDARSGDRTGPQRHVLEQEGGRTVPGQIGLQDHP